MRQMKDSGIEWIGEIPESWDTMRLRNHFSFGKGLPITKADLTESGVSVISYGQIHSKANIGTRIKPELIRYVDDKYLDTNDSSLVSKGSFIFADTSEDISGCGNCVYVDVEYPLFAGYHTMILRPENESFTKYYSYLFATDAWRSQIRAQASGVKLFSITQKMLQDTVLIEPSEEEKVRIVDYLDKKCAEIDAIIAAKEKTNEFLKERRQSIIYEAVTKGLDPTVPMKDSGFEWIGTIPSTWKIRKLRYLGSCSNGISKAGEFFGSGSPFVSYGDVYKNMELPREVSGLIETTAEEQQLYSVEEGDVFFTRTSETIEEVAISSTCMQTIENATFAGFLIRFRPNTELLAKEFSKYYFRSEMHRFFFVKEMNLVTRASLSQDLLKKLPVLLPPVEEQKRIASYLDNECSNIDELIATNESTIEKLKEYRQSVIYEAVTGKVEI